MKKKVKKLIAYSIPLVVLLIFGELVMHTYDYFTSTNLYRFTLVEDDKLGWRTKANFRDEYKNGNGVLVQYQTGKNGFKTYGALTEKQRVLILGDSFTQSVEVSNDDTYYAHLASAFDYDFFVYGMSGYGTLQEKMILEENLAAIQPDLLILQFCSNDFIDNHFELNQACNYKINSTRPYQTLTNKIVYANPFPLKEQIFSKLYFTDFINSKLNNIISKMNPTESGEGKIARLKQEYLPFKHSIAITKNLLKTIKDSLPQQSKMLVFCSDGYEPQLATIRTICNELDIEYLEDPIHQLRKSKTEGENPYAKDGVHWNELGHGIVGKAVAKKMVEMLSPP
ncbi:MAG: SGNH/GDSL hydrolase family protein [Saprospiraceae bacterium]